MIDIPIGLLDSEPRVCDVEARRLLGARRSSVFPAPVRAMLSALTYREACAIRFRHSCKQCSKQLFNILGEIVEVDAAMTPALQRRVREGHPEVVFAAMNGGAPMRDSKSTPAGRSERLALLRRHFADVDDRLRENARLRATNDIIDAYACLWTARRVAAGEEQRLSPTCIQRDARGLRAEIVC